MVEKKVVKKPVKKPVEYLGDIEKSRLRIRLNKEWYKVVTDKLIDAVGDIILPFYIVCLSIVVSVAFPAYLYSSVVNRLGISSFDVVTGGELILNFMVIAVMLFFIFVSIGIFGIQLWNAKMKKKWNIKKKK